MMSNNEDSASESNVPVFENSVVYVVNRLMYRICDCDRTQADVLKGFTSKEKARLFMEEELKKTEKEWLKWQRRFEITRSSRKESQYCNEQETCRIFENIHEADICQFQIEKISLF